MLYAYFYFNKLNSNIKKQNYPIHHFYRSITNIYTFILAVIEVFFTCLWNINIKLHIPI